MAARPWESRSNLSMTDKDFNDHASFKSSVSRSVSVMGETNVTPSLTPITQRVSRPPSRNSPSTPSRVHSTNPNGRIKSASPKNRWPATDDDSRSMMSVQSKHHRRHNIAGSLVRDDESLASSPTVPSYMASTKSAKAKTKMASPLGAMEKNGGTPDKVSMWMWMWMRECLDFGIHEGELGPPALGMVASKFS